MRAFRCIIGNCCCWPLAVVNVSLRVSFESNFSVHVALKYIAFISTSRAIGSSSPSFSISGIMPWVLSLHHALILPTASADLLKSMLLSWAL